jgi:outer membrane protein TolC
VLDSVVSAYYILIFRREDYIVRFQGLELSREQLRNTEEKIRLGELAPRDRIADQADVAKKEEELISAENAILDAEDGLRRLILPFRQEAAWDVVIVPTDELGETDPEVVIPETETAVARALVSRADLQASRRRADAVDQQVLKAERDLLPGLDLTALYSADSQQDDFNAVQKDIFIGDFPEYLVRLGLVLPIGNLAARSNYNKAKLQAETARRNVQILTIDIQKEVREALRRLATAGKVIAAARESVRLAQNNLDAERTRLQLGDQTQFEVQRRNQELQDARTRLIQARLDYRAAWFHLLAVEGQLSASSRLPTADREERGK